MRAQPISREQSGTSREDRRPIGVTKTGKSVPHLFDSWDQISRKISAAKDIHLFLDFDGTLVPYCNSPEDVKLSRECRSVLVRLARHRRVHVAIVSGRRNAVLRKYVQVPHTHFLGLFGWENRRGPALPRMTRGTIRHLRTLLAPLPKLFPGIRVEEKGAGYAVHFREASPDTLSRAQPHLRKLLARGNGDFRVLQSNHACEIVPHGVLGKGAAMREFVREIKGPFLPIYVGDDLTDEPAFQALRRGITVRVGPHPRTHARFKLKDPAEVCDFLERIENEVS